MLKLLVASWVPDGNGGEVFADTRERPPLAVRSTDGMRFDCASSTCARAASMRASATFKSQLLANASSISALSTGSLNAVHQCCKSSFCAAVALPGGKSYFGGTGCVTAQPAKA